MIATIEFRIFFLAMVIVKNTKIVMHESVIIPVYVDWKLGLVLLRDRCIVRVFEESLLMKILSTEETMK
jgi:hypothetical protein